VGRPLARAGFTGAALGSHEVYVSGPDAEGEVPGRSLSRRSCAFSAVPQTTLWVSPDAVRLQWQVYYDAGLLKLRW